MDVRMPVMDGLEATRRIRAFEGEAGMVPIVAMTADAMPEDVAASQRAGMDGHLAKPINLAVLADVVGRALSGELVAQRSAA